MKKWLLASMGVVFIFTHSLILYAQETAMTYQGVAVSLADTNVGWNAMSDLEVELKAVESVPPMPAESLPESGTYWSAQHNPESEEPWPPLPTTFGMGAWSLGDDGVYLLDDLDHLYVSPKKLKSATTTSSGGMMTMNVDLNPGDGGGDTNGDGGGYSGSWTGTPIDTNGLWLQITNFANGLAYLNLNNATDYVYAVWSTTNLLTRMTNWNLETELFPGINTNVLPFTVAELDRTNMLFLRAEDWTDVTENGNYTPDWWFWEYFGTIALSDTNLDSQGNILYDDYYEGVDPNIISFTLTVTNNYVNSMSVPVQLNISAGTPSYYAVSVDDTNYEADAIWQTYTGTNITVYLGANPGEHSVWIGLKGLPVNATQAWQWKQLNLTPPPALVITNPAGNVVSQPMIQIYGYSLESLASISYDISNAVGVVTGQQSEITDRYFDTNVWDFTTNYFECLDVPLTNGLNKITLHATDLAGNVTATNFNFTLDYSGKTDPPALQITWPTNGTQISGSNFTCRGTIGDPTSTVSTQLIFTNSNTNLFWGGIYTNVYVASVERNGNFWLENLPINAGTNAFTITVTDAVGNMSVTNISVIQSALAMTINPVTPDSQLWQPTVNLTGTISDSTSAVWVNGVKGHNNGNGTWSASNVPVNDGGTASFTATAYSPTEQQPDGSYGN